MSLHKSSVINCNGGQKFFFACGALRIPLEISNETVFSLQCFSFGPGFVLGGAYVLLRRHACSPRGVRRRQLPNTPRSQREVQTTRPNEIHRDQTRSDEIKRDPTRSSDSKAPKMIQAAPYQTGQIESLLVASWRSISFDLV